MGRLSKSFQFKYKFLNVDASGTNRGFVGDCVIQLEIWADLPAYPAECLVRNDPQNVDTINVVTFQK